MTEAARNIRWFTYPTDYGYVVHSRILDPVTRNEAGLERHFRLQDLVERPETCRTDLYHMQRRLLEFVA
jgi:hypothetical protein